ncbi:MAG TPA: hypothetical protein VLQ93_25280 [Myxococcaceae bacterium]|nr:hypothetical protein [Myxococcaceae bacterium]
MAAHSCCTRARRRARIRHGVWRLGLLLLASGVPALAQEPEPEQAAPGPESLVDNPRVDVEKARWRPGKGLEFVSEDGRFRLVTRVRGQFLYLVEDAFVGVTEERQREHAFLIRRARVSFSGNTFGEHNKFKLELALSPRDLALRDLGGEENPPITNRDNVPTLSPLLDFYLEFDYLRDFTLMLGQYKVPFNRERVISSGDLMLVDRSIVNAEFNLDRDLGLDLRSEDLLGLGRLRYYVGVYVGEGHSAYALEDFDLMMLARVEVLPFGEFVDYSEADLERRRKPGLSIGVAAAHVDDAKGLQGLRGRTPRDGGTTDYTLFTADALFKWSGLSAQSEFILRKGTRNPGDAVDEAGNPLPIEAPRNGWGGFLQVGYLLPTTDLELAARYSLIRPRGGATETSLQAANALGGGLSYYFHGHPFKLQGDYLHLWEEDFDRGDNQLRVQLQASF